MNWVDFVIIGIIAISVIVSFFRGFLREALSLLVWGLAIWLSIVYYADVEGFAELIPVSRDLCCQIPQIAAAEMQKHLFHYGPPGKSLT